MIHEVILPKLSMTMTEGTIVKWLVAEGDHVHDGDVLFEVESDKAVLESESTCSGQVLRILCSEGTKLPVLTVVALIGEAGADISEYTQREPTVPEGGQVVGAPENAAAPKRSMSPATSRTVDRKKVLASPRARRLAKEHEVDLSRVQGSGSHGKIVEDDVLTYLEAASVLTDASPTVAIESHLQKITERVNSACEAVQMTGIRAVIAERMVTSARTTARVTLSMEVDVTRLVEARAELKQALSKELGFAVSYNDLLIVICARALREYPVMNCRLEGESIRVLDDINIGLAVDTEQGLLVPVVRNADELGLIEIAGGVRELVGRARQRRSLPDELSGGTFTITNLGMYGIDVFTPIINLPECGILGVGRIKPEPKVVGSQIVVRQCMWLNLTFDHRLIDGAPAAKFLRRISEYIEEPLLLLG